MTLQYIKYTFSIQDFLVLDEDLRQIESQHHGVTFWNTFMFLYEMLGVSHFILPLLDIDIKSVRNEDVHHFLGNQVYLVALENIEHEVLVQPKLHQAHSFKNQLETLEIWDKDLNLKPFKKFWNILLSLKPIQLIQR